MAETTDLKWELYEIWMHIKWVSNHLCRLSSSINKQSLSPTPLCLLTSDSALATVEPAGDDMLG